MAHKHVKLVSRDGFEFIIDYKAACVSKTLNNMIGPEGCFSERELGEIQLKEISGRVLENACRYFYYNLQCRDLNVKTLPLFKLEPNVAVELLIAANFLDT